MKPLHLSVPFILVLVLVTRVLSGNVLGYPGGISSEDKPVTPEVKQLIRGIHPQIQSHLEGSVPGGVNLIGKVKPISYRTQVVNGVNYFVKVRARTPNKNVFYHLRIFKGFDGAPAQLLKVEGPKRKRDAINFF